MRHAAYKIQLLAMARTVFWSGVVQIMRIANLKPLATTVDWGTNPRASSVLQTGVKILLGSNW